jgi:ABC-type oligopeptide transport system substrate-binding subunit
MLKHYSWFPVPKARHRESTAKWTDRNTRWTRPGNIVCNGPFKLKSWRMNQTIEVDRNPHYWDAASVKLNGITFLPIVSDTTEERAFLDGQLHVTLTLPLAKIPGYRESNSPFFHNDPLLSVYFYRCNTTRRSPSTTRVRRALALAIDRESITRNILRAGQKPATGLTPPGCGILTIKSPTSCASIPWRRARSSPRPASRRQRFSSVRHPHQHQRIPPHARRGRAVHVEAASQNSRRCFESRLGRLSRIPAQARIR